MKEKYIYLALLFIAAISERIFLDLGPNVELVTMAMILSSFYFGRKESTLLTLAIMVFSDLIIGNSSIFIFTWTGFLIPSLFSKRILQLLTTNNQQLKKKIFTPLKLTSVGLISNIFFFFWTNFGVWLIGNMYPKTIFGLLQSYLNALPFLRYQVVSTLVFLPLGYVITEIAIKMSKKYSVKKIISFHSN